MLWYPKLQVTVGLGGSVWDFQSWWCWGGTNASLFWLLCSRCCCYQLVAYCFSEPALHFLKSPAWPSFTSVSMKESSPVASQFLFWLASPNSIQGLHVFARPPKPHPSQPSHLAAVIWWLIFCSSFCSHFMKPLACFPVFQTRRWWFSNCLEAAAAYQGLRELALIK